MSTNTPFTVYDEATGKIKRTGACAQKLVPFQAMEGEISIAVPSDPLTQRVRLSDNEIIEKTPLTIQLDRTESVIDTQTPIVMSGIPDGVDVYVDGDRFQATGGVLEVQFAERGPHVIWVDDLNYQHAYWEVSAI